MRVEPGYATLTDDDTTRPVPDGTARMRHFTIRLDSHERLDHTLGLLPDVTEVDQGYTTTDPSGNRILLPRL